MPKPITPMVGCDTFVVNEREEVCLVRRADNGLWALPGGYQDLGETPVECAAREFREETGLLIKVTRLLGVYSSTKYSDPTGVLRGHEVTHILYQGVQVGGQEQPSPETPAIGWYASEDLPELSSGHARIIRQGFRSLSDSDLAPHME